MKGLTITQIQRLISCLRNPNDLELGYVKRHSVLVPIHKELLQEDKKQEWKEEIHYFKVVSSQSDISAFTLIDEKTWQYLGENCIQ